MVVRRREETEGDIWWTAAGLLKKWRERERDLVARVSWRSDFSLWRREMFVVMLVVSAREFRGGGGFRWEEEKVRSGAGTGCDVVVAVVRREMEEVAAEGVRCWWCFAGILVEGERRKVAGEAGGGRKKREEGKEGVRRVFEG
ncbi:hypothetical protein HAX54_006903 [Datura stramonium]|uniref:Uncharacterized protein n=1 Tax=Datura stramonium TaxID=4076 RepID=A0ABS8TCC3_DATST|nr:hypothetical protein [Datura stramonium]